MSIILLFLWIPLLIQCNSGDRPLKEALTLMNNEGVSSLAVVDNQYNVVGNISIVDVKVNYLQILVSQYLR